MTAGFHDQQLRITREGLSYLLVPGARWQGKPVYILPGRGGRVWVWQTHQTTLLRQPAGRYGGWRSLHLLQSLAAFGCVRMAGKDTGTSIQRYDLVPIFGRQPSPTSRFPDLYPGEAKSFLDQKTPQVNAIRFDRLMLLSPVFSR